MSYRLIAGIAVLLSSAASAQQPQTITVHASKYKFTPSEITLHVGEPVRLVFISDDDPHGISVDGLPVDMDFEKGAPGTVTITPAKVAEYTGVCSVYCGPGHSEMKLAIHVIN